MTLAGKHGIGIISIGSMSNEGLQSLPQQWAFAEELARKHGKTADRAQWRVLLSWHIAETREKARIEARDGLLRHHNEYILGTLQRPGLKPYTSPDEAVDKTAFSDGAAATIGTPDDLVAKIKSVLEVSGGFGTVVGFVHDWANPDNTFRSWDLVARYVVPRSTATSRHCGSRRSSLSRTAACSSAVARPSWRRSWRTRMRLPRSPSPSLPTSPHRGETCPICRRLGHHATRSNAGKALPLMRSDALARHLVCLRLRQIHWREILRRE